IPKGSRNKYEYDHDMDVIKLDRFLFSSMVYPTDYGFIPDTLGQDTDPLDAMVLVSEPTFPGCVIEVKAIALFRMEDDKGIDDKVLCVPLTDPAWNTLETLEDVPTPLKDGIAHAWFASLRAGGARHSQDARLGWYIVLGTIPIGIFGLAFKDQIENGARDLYLIGTMLIVFGLVMLAADRYARRERPIETMTPADGLTVGVAQAFALVPGVSRSGATIAAGLFRGLTREAAARYSFLLSTPAIVLSALFESRKFIRGDETGASGFELALATLFAFIVGYWSIRFLLRY